MKLVISAVAALRFFRLGRAFPQTGVLVDEDEFSEADWKVLRAEKRLHIREATEDELEAGRAGVDAPDAEAEALLDLQIDEAIRTLAASDFGGDGRPSVSALKKALPAARERITGARRDIVFAGMTEAGFAAPVAGT